MPFVLDASVALTWHFEDEASEYADRVLARLTEDEPVAPALWPLEIANGLLAGERRGRINEAGVVAAARQTLDLPVRLYDQRPEEALGRILEIARTQHLTVYDAAYLDVAMREGLALATLDDDLRRAAVQVGVRLVD